MGLLYLYLYKDSEQRAATSKFTATKKFRAKPSSDKVMLTQLWESKRPILGHYISKGTMITSSSYCDLLVNYLKPAIRSKRCGLPINGVLPLHDNAQPHTAHVTVTKIKDLHYECLPHPPYLPDLVPSDFQEAVQEILFFRRDSGFSTTLELMY